MQPLIYMAALECNELFVMLRICIFTAQCCAGVAVCVCVNCMYHLLSNYMSLCVVHSCMHAKWHNNPLPLLSPVIEACPSYVPTLYGCIYSWLHNSVCQFRVCPYAHTHTHAHTCRGSNPVNGPVNFSAFSGFSLVCVCLWQIVLRCNCKCIPCMCAGWLCEHVADTFSNLPPEDDQLENRVIHHLMAL